LEQFGDCQQAAVFGTCIQPATLARGLCGFAVALVAELLEASPAQAAHSCERPVQQAQVATAAAAGV